MPKVVILGTSNGIPNEEHENTHLAVQSDERWVMIDCVGNPIVRTLQAGLKHDELSDIVLSHFHPDHVSGLPLLLMGMGLSMHSKPLAIHGLAQTLSQVKALLTLFRWETFVEFPVSFEEIPAEELMPVVETDAFTLLTSPVNHFIPTVGFRIEFKASGKVLAYSCDTAPTASVVRLAENADVLLHEATGGSGGHSSAAQAGEVAKAAGARALYLIHYPIVNVDLEALAEEAAKTFGNEVRLAKDLMTFEF